MINELCKKSAIKLTNSINDYSKISKIVCHNKNKSYKLLSEDEVTSVFEYAFRALYGETSKILIVLLIAYLLGILAPTLIIMSMFIFIRISAGGVHMHTYIECLISTCLIFIPLGLLVKVLSKSTVNFYILIPIIMIASFYTVYKYAPRDTPTKIIDKQEDIMRYKNLTYVRLVVSFATILTLYICGAEQYILISMNIGILTEMFMITPIALKLFNSILKIVDRK